MVERIALFFVLIGIVSVASCRASGTAKCSTSETERAARMEEAPPPPRMEPAPKVEAAPEPSKPAAAEKAPPAAKPGETIRESGEITQVGEGFWDNGKLKVREEMKLDEDGEWILHGKVEHFWEDGSRKLEMFYREGLPHGPKTVWYPDGQVYHTGQYIDGREHGVWLTYFPSGAKQSELNLNLGAFDGAEIRWHENGNKAMYGQWVKGKQAGFFTFWSEDGKISREVDYGPPPEAAAPKAENK
jgi:hypothetical protein